MKKILLFIFSIMIVFSLCSCSKETADHKPAKEDAAVSETGTLPKEKEIGNYLFNAENAVTIEISGKELWDRKEAWTSTESAGKNIDLGIKRDEYGVGIAMDLFSDTDGADLVSWLGEEALDDGCSAKDGFYYQMSAYDFNNDGEKEIIVASGNKKDVLVLRVFGFHPDEDCSSINPQVLAELSGSCKSYVNKDNEICVIDAENNILSVYSYMENSVSKNSKMDMIYGKWKILDMVGHGYIFGDVSMKDYVGGVITIREDYFESDLPRGKKKLKNPSYVLTQQSENDFWEFGHANIDNGFGFKKNWITLVEVYDGKEDWDEFGGTFWIRDKKHLIFFGPVYFLAEKIE